MDLNEIFRGLFGLPNRRRNDDDWQNKQPGHLDDDDDDDEDDAFSFGFNSHGQDNSDKSRTEFFFGFPGGRGGLDGMFEHFHGDMQRQMEHLHQQMEDMMKGFGSIDFPPVEHFPPKTPAHPPMVDSGDEKRNPNPFQWFGTISPFFRHHGPPRSPATSPRDFMLKDEDGSEDFGIKKSPLLPIPDKENLSKKGDTDLDGKLSEEDIMSLVKSPSPDSQQISRPRRQQPQFFSSSSSVTFSSFQGADGKVEQKKVVRDSEGREHTTITRSLGDKSHSVTTIIGNDGKQEKHETFTNMAEDEIGGFEKNWSESSQKRHPPINPAIPADSLIKPDSEISPHDRDLFSRLFGPKN